MRGKGEGERKKKIHNTVKTWIRTTDEEAVTKGMHS